MPRIVEDRPGDDPTRSSTLSGVVEGVGRERTACGPPPPSAFGCHLRLNGEEFGRSATRLAGLAGLTFGWPPDTFWAATPAELAALVTAAGGDTADPPDPLLVTRLMEMFPDG
ncbi:phage tail assembly chaperone [Sphingomonas sp.]|jgi:hypothetical protein|uniref:phage tail assembly chaperone n=1 Tax=Sphingomonas sp. TaxID=28214 RepID=UPI002E324A6A|nr:phage tail assembly chaperone [Sphingomonas sp.]HEX4695721.1 phage tail assembly chaperone [Sphingomonas sp.]